MKILSFDVNHAQVVRYGTDPCYMFKEDQQTLQSKAIFHFRSLARKKGSDISPISNAFFASNVAK